MRSIVLPALLCLSLSGCGMVSYSLTANLASGQPSEKAPPRSHPVSTAEAKPKVAAATYDKAPKGSYEKAPRGALAERDYSHTRLDAEKARDLVNAYRKAKGLKPLKLQPALTEAARAHARDLAKWDRISHFGSDGSNPWDRVKRAGYNAKLAAENLCRAYAEEHGRTERHPEAGVRSDVAAGRAAAHRGDELHAEAHPVWNALHPHVMPACEDAGLEAALDFR